MLRECGRDKGQTIVIAACKYIGTRTPSIYGTPEGNRFIPVMEGICFVWDVIYIVELKKVKEKSKNHRHSQSKVFCQILYGLVFCAFTVS